MATTKKAVVATTAGKTTAPASKPAASAAARPAPPRETEQQIAEAYLADRVYDALLERGEASKISEVVVEINNPRLTFPLVRRALLDSPRFMAIDRAWDLAARYLDTSRPTERTLKEVLKAAGRPLSNAQLATELSIIYNRPSDIYLPLVARLTDSNDYFRTAGNELALSDWLPLIDSDEQGDILFDNQVKPEVLRPLQEAGKGVAWDNYAEATYRILSRLGSKPIRHRTLGVVGWIALGPRYDRVAHLRALLKDSRFVWLSGAKGGRWITRTVADKLEVLLEERAATLGGDEQEETAPEPVAVAAAEPVVEAAPEPVEAPAPLEPVATPLAISEADLAALTGLVADRGAPVEISELLAIQYEVMAGDASFRADLATLTERLRGDDRFLYIGAGRVREPNSLPLFVHSIPEILAHPELQFISMDGEIMDEEIEDEGFAGTLRQEMSLPLAQDAGDDDGHYTGPVGDDALTVRCVVKAHHKEIGTFPLCQIPDGFFPTDAEIVEVVVRDPQGKAHEIVVNRATDVRLAFQLFGLYEQVEAESGGVFLLHRTARPFEYRFEAVAEPDAQVAIDATRMAELQALREHVEETGDMATFDIVCEVLEAYPKGLDFVQTITEVNIVRRVTRRKLASILSNYYCFAQKAGSSLWRFDQKKREMGTDRTKRKYIKR